MNEEQAEAQAALEKTLEDAGKTRPRYGKLTLADIDRLRDRAKYE